jgi:hypothetical protein
MGTGDGSTKTFSGTLAQCTGYDGDLQVFVAGAIKAGDPGDGMKATSFSSTDNFYTNEDSSKTTHGTINTSTCAWSLTFLNAPANGAAITGTYSNGGWARGSALEDEAGQSTYIGSIDLYTLSGLAAAGKIDWDNFQYYVTKQYVGSMRRAFNKAAPGVMLIAEDPVGGYSVTANPTSLQAVCQYSDVFAPSSIPNVDPGNATSDSQARADAASASCGDIPWFEFFGATHVLDSAFVNKWSTDGTFTGGNSSAPDFFNGRDLGVWMRDTYMPLFWNSFTVSCGGNCTGTHPFAGFGWLAGVTLRLDFWHSNFFDLYDGREAILNASVDSKGNPIGCVAVAGIHRCESAKSTDMVTPLSEAMSMWLNNIPRVHATGAMGGKAQ